MKEAGEVLAWRSGAGIGKLYEASDLTKPEKLKELFAACKEAQGYITADGWAFLFRIWRLEELLEMDLDSGWFYSGGVEDSAAHLIYQSLMAGFDPLSGEKGDYDPDSGLFISLEGKKHKVDWDEIRGKGS